MADTPTPADPRAKSLRAMVADKRAIFAHVVRDARAAIRVETDATASIVDPQLKPRAAGACGHIGAEPEKSKS